MHQFLSSVGFGSLKKKEEVDRLIQDIIDHPMHKIIYSRSDGVLMGELCRDFAEYMGIAVRGEYDDEGQFQPEYYFPYYCGPSVSTRERVDVERHSDRDVYSGVCDEPRLGITLIFYLQNALEYLKEANSNRLHGQYKTALSGLSSHGMILLPIHEGIEAKSPSKNINGMDRVSLVEAAREGDEEAMESLTLEDIDTYSMLSKRVQHEDVMTIVKSYFMPYGIESDQYNVMGKITDYRYTVNQETGEEVCILSLICNDISFDVCINSNNLLGQPEIGRRFKGVIWLQGATFLN